MKMVSRRSNPNVRKVVKSILDSRVEHKQITFDFSATSLSAGVVTNITEGIVQGDGVNNRSGNQIIVDHIDFHISAVSAANVSSYLRVILLVDRINLGSRPSVTDVISTAVPSSSYAVQGRVQNRFKILADFNLLTSQANNSNGTNVILSGLPAIAATKHTIRLRDKVYYNAATAVAGANGKGAIHMLFIDQTNSGCTYTVGMNIAYTDS